MQNTETTKKIDQARELLKEAANEIIFKDMPCAERDAYGMLFSAMAIADDAALLLEKAAEKEIAA